MELRAFEARGYPRIPKYDKVPLGRLVITVNGGIPVRQSSFADTKTINLTDRLPELLQELELRAASTEERRREAEHEANERRRRWEQVRDEATIALSEDHRARVLTAQAAQWRKARALDEYLTALEEHTATLTGLEQVTAHEWLTWARGHLATQNPLDGTLSMPPDPEVTPGALQPFMRGLSPYGPNRQYGW